MTLLLIAVAPAVILLFYMRRKDKIEKEPVKLILKLLFWGAVSALPAAAYESFMIDGILAEMLPETSLAFKIIDNIFITAFAEELVKYIVTKRCTWSSKEFNCTFDGAVYAVAASLGFAVLENIFYVFSYGMSTAIMRAIFSIPGHAIFGVYMGYYYGLAKSAFVMGDKKGMRVNKRKALWIPILLHGAWDLCLSLESGLFMLVFFAAYVVLFIVTVKKINSMSKADAYIGAPVMPAVPVMPAAPEKAEKK